MPSKNNVYTVTKVEHDFGLSKIKPKFNRMPELYLELLVNKNKVNPTLAAEKYEHRYESDGVERIKVSSVPPPTILPISRKDGTFTWDSYESNEPSPIIQKRVSRMVSSPPQIGSVGSCGSRTISSDKYQKVKKSIISSYCKKHSPPPPLKEIKKTYGDVRPKVIQLDINDDDDHKRELLFKFKQLKKTYPKMDLPDFNMMSNHDHMQKTYDATIKNLAIDSTVEGYKSYLMMGFMGCEMLLGKVGFDMEGYTQQQILHMNKYEKLLIELGEKSYIPSSVNKWPVEVRIVALVVFQTTIFVVSKVIAKKTNVNLLQMYNSITGVQQPQFDHVSSSGFVSGGSSPLTFIPKTGRIPSTNSESRMKGPTPPPPPPPPPSTN